MIRCFPHVVRRENQWFIFILSAIFTCVLYLSSNYYPLNEPSHLTLTFIDHSVPLMSWTVWIYLSEYLLFILAVYFCSNPFLLNRFFYAFILLQLLSFVVFLVYPTTFPREIFTLSGEATSISDHVFLYLREVDPPNNCLPSLHVASCVLFSMIYFREDWKKFSFFMGWTLLITLSTLTTKQHYLMDIFAGVIGALLCYFVGFVLLDNKDVQERAEGESLGRPLVFK